MQKFIYAIAGLIVLLLVVGLALPRHARVQVQTQIDANPATVFALANDFHRYTLWSPWLDTDPNAHVVYSGPVRGVGATMTWDGAIVGTGTQSITASAPFEHIEMTINPGESGEARTWFNFAAENGTTITDWTFETDYGYNVVGRYFALVLEGIIQRDYTKGLASLKDLAETLPRADFSDLEIEQLTVEAADIAYLSTTSVPEPAAMSEAMGDAYFEVLSFIDEHQLTDAGAPLSVTRSFSGARLRFDAAIPVRGIDESTPRDSAGVKIGETYAGKVLKPGAGSDRPAPAGAEVAQ